MSTSTAASLMPVSVKIPEAARLLGFHDSKTIYRLIRAGKLKARKVGHNYLVSYKSIVKLIEG
ncbi:helix-turn-helix domain-containing protein [Bifidobacterium pullorum]|uniref:helix-turn-helix domain-containing protein n=1 Tax=Bifidobacterium pullorum TaxID=78448 RepID=UPI00307CC1AA